MEVVVVIVVVVVEVVVVVVKEIVAIAIAELAEVVIAVVGVVVICCNRRGSVCLFVCLFASLCLILNVHDHDCHVSALSARHHHRSCLVWFKRFVCFNRLFWLRLMLRLKSGSRSRFKLEARPRPRPRPRLMPMSRLRPKTGNENFLGEAQCKEFR